MRANPLFTPRSGRITLSLLAVVVLLMALMMPAVLVGSTSTALAQNVGTIKVDGIAFDETPGNEPKVDCQFQIDFFGFDEGDIADITITTQGGAGPLEPGMELFTATNVDIGEDPAGGGTDIDANVDVDLSGALDQFDEPQLVKVVIETDAGTKTKVFMVGPCEVEASPSPSPEPSPSPSPCPIPDNQQGGEDKGCEEPVESPSPSPCPIPDNQQGGGKECEEPEVSPSPMPDGEKPDNQQEGEKPDTGAGETPDNQQEGEKPDTGAGETPDNQQGEMPVEDDKPGELPVTGGAPVGGLFSLFGAATAAVAGLGLFAVRRQA